MQLRASPGRLRAHGRARVSKDFSQRQTGWHRRRSYSDMRRSQRLTNRSARQRTCSFVDLLFDTYICPRGPSTPHSSRMRHEEKPRRRRTRRNEQVDGAARDKRTPTTTATTLYGAKPTSKHRGSRSKTCSHTLAARYFTMDKMLKDASRRDENEYTQDL